MSDRIVQLPRDAGPFRLDRQHLRHLPLTPGTLGQRPQPLLLKQAPDPLIPARGVPGDEEHHQICD
jgi:hypothetical protein